MSEFKKRIIALEQKLIDKIKGNDEIDLESWENHPDELLFTGWDKIEDTIRETNNEIS